MSKRPFINQSDESDEEFSPPPIKRTKLEKPAHNKKPFHITDVPIDCLMHIFSRVNIWHHNRIRATCKYFQAAHNIYLEHEFLKAINNFRKRGEKNVSAAILNSIQQATNVYVNVGYESVMYNCLLPLLRRAYRTPFDLENQNIKVFLSSFFTTVDKCMENSASPQALVLYMMTMLNLLKCFRNYEFTATEKYRNFSLYIIVPDIWMGTLFRRTIPGRDKCNAILVTLTLLLVGSISEQAFKYVYEFEEEVFLFGSDAVDGTQNSKTEFKINIRGSEKVRSFFKKWMYGSKEQEIELPHNLCDERFQFDVTIACKSATHWGCPPTKVLHIVPKL